MCNRHSQDLGYICDECFDELVSKGKTSMAEFMWTIKGNNKVSPEDTYYVCDQEFPMGYQD